MNYSEILKRGETFLKKSNIKNAHLDAELILSKTINTKREEVLLNINKKINNKDIYKFKKYLLRRKQKEPIAYILGFKYFWKYKFYVNKSVLIPRPDTELVIEEFLKLVSKNKSIKILDIGTGSGCIVISLIKERPNCIATGIDISIKAINVAKTNAKLHHLENKVNFINIDIDKYKSYNYDFIISNPPYINSIDYNIKSKKLLKRNGKLILEIGYKQKDRSIKLLVENGYFINKVSKDLSGNDRCIVSTKL